MSTAEELEGEVAEDSSPLDLSDDDFNAALEKALNEPNEEVEEDGLQEQEEESEEIEDDTDSDVDSTDDTVSDSGNEEKVENTQDVFTNNSNTIEEVEAPSKEETTEEVDTNNTEINYRSEYEKLLSPFKANGKEMQVSNIDEARQLMQMGANYNKKMAGLKPSLKIVKMLDNNGLLDEDKLSYLIDLDKKDPDAIRKLLKESNIDPIDIDISEDISYKPNNYGVNDKEMELDGILEEIQGTESFNKTIDVITNKFDDSSKRVLLENPGIIKVINEHVANGIYDQITHVVEHERMLGRLTGLTDLEAYKQVGDAIHARGGFNQPSATEATNTSQPIKKTVDPKLKSKKKAAGLTRPSSKKTVQDSFNPLALSDEEFEKQFNSKFI